MSLGTVRPYTKTNVPSPAAGQKFISDHASNGVGVTDWADLLVALQLELGNNMTIEEVANATARDALTVSAGQVGKRLVRLADTGVIYLANATGSGSSKWTQYHTDAAATTSVAGIVELATNAEGATGTDNTRAMTAAATQAAVAPLRNALAPRGGVRFTGVSSTNIKATLTGQSLGTDPKSVVVTFKVPGSNPSTPNGLFWIGPSATNGANERSLQAYILGSGQLQLVLRAATSGDYAVCASNDSIVSTHGGQVVQLAVVCLSDGSRKAYINDKEITLGADSTGGTAPATWLSSITSTYFGLGVGNETTDVANFEFYSASLYNCELSASDVLEIYRLNGAVPFRFQWGTQTASYTSNFSSTVDSWVAAGGATRAAASSKLEITVPASGTAGCYRADPAFTRQKAFRVSFRHRLQSGDRTAWEVQDANNNGFAVLSGTKSFTTAGTAATHSLVVMQNVPQGDGALYLSAMVDGAQSVLELDNVVITPAGAICHYALDEGIGYQIHDASTNKLDAVMTTTGVHHLIAKREGYVRTPGSGLTWAGSHELKAITGVDQRIIPNSAVIKRIVTKSSAATTGAGLLITDALVAARFVAANAVTTDKKVHTVANATPSATSDAATGFNIDPDSNNYTGTVQATIEYCVTEGDPV